MKKKNAAAVALGCLGGKKSASNMTPAQRKARAKKAVTAREAKKFLRALSDSKSVLNEFKKHKYNENTKTK
jgi:hypothetical protein